MKRRTLSRRERVRAPCLWLRRAVQGAGPCRIQLFLFFSQMRYRPSVISVSR